MRSMKLAILVGASLSAALAMWFMNSALQSRAVVPSPVVAPEPVVEVVETSEILVAARSIPIGRRIEPDDLRWQNWPTDSVLEYHYTKEEMPNAIEDLEGHASRLPILDGEPLSNEKVIDIEGTGVMASLLRNGMRAVAVPLSEVTGAGGFILPGDFVDILLTRQIELPNYDDETGELLSATTRNFTETIMKTVRVVAIDQSLNDEGQTSAKANTATLELKPEQAELITLTRQLAKQDRGFITLSLRSFSEMVDLFGDGLDKVQPETILDLQAVIEKEKQQAEILRQQYERLKMERARKFAAERRQEEREQKRLAEEERLRALYEAEIEAQAARAAAQQVTVNAGQVTAAAPQQAQETGVVLIRNGSPIVVHAIQNPQQGNTAANGQGGVQ